MVGRRSMPILYMDLSQNEYMALALDMDTPIQASQKEPSP